MRPPLAQGKSLFSPFSLPKIVTIALGRRLFAWKCLATAGQHLHSVPFIITYYVSLSRHLFHEQNRWPSNGGNTVRSAEWKNSPCVFIALGRIIKPDRQSKTRLSFKKMLHCCRFSSLASPEHIHPTSKLTPVSLLLQCRLYRLYSSSHPYFFPSRWCKRTSNYELLGGGGERRERRERRKEKEREGEGV